jgi:hypothetical protein
MKRTHQNSVANATMATLPMVSHSAMVAQPSSKKTTNCASTDEGECQEDTVECFCSHCKNPINAPDKPLGSSGVGFVACSSAAVSLRN